MSYMLVYPLNFHILDMQELRLSVHELLMMVYLDTANICPKKRWKLLLLLIPIL